jgi:hypothetical protein
MTPLVIAKVDVESNGLERPPPSGASWLRRKSQTATCEPLCIYKRAYGCDNAFDDLIRSASIDAHFSAFVSRLVMKHSAATGRPARSRIGAAMQSRKVFDSPSVQQ